MQTADGTPGVDAAHERFTNRHIQRHIMSPGQEVHVAHFTAFLACCMYLRELRCIHSVDSVRYHHKLQQFT